MTKEEAFKLLKSVNYDLFDKEMTVFYAIAVLSDSSSTVPTYEVQVRAFGEVIFVLRNPPVTPPSHIPGVLCHPKSREWEDLKWRIDL